MATIARFTLVQIDSVIGGKPAVIPWTPAAYEQPGLATAHKLLGVTATASAYGEPVATMMRGYLRAVTEQNSETWAAGDILWAKSDGSITKTRPTAPTPLVVVGTVFADEDAGTNFTIDVDVRVLPSLGELSGVKVETPVDLDVLIFASATHTWDPRQLIGADVANTPAGGIAATTVQAAVNELDTEKANLASPTFTGIPAAPTAAVGTTTTQIATTAFVDAEAVAKAGDSMTGRLTITLSGNSGFIVRSTDATFDSAMYQNVLGAALFLSNWDLPTVAQSDATKSTWFFTMNPAGDFAAIGRYPPGGAATTLFRINNAGNVGIGTTAPTTIFDANGDTMRLRTAKTPASAAAAGDVGSICWDASYIYICTATNTWKRVAIATW